MNFLTFKFVNVHVLVQELKIANFKIYNYLNLKIKKKIVQSPKYIKLEKSIFQRNQITR